MSTYSELTKHEPHDRAWLDHCEDVYYTLEENHAEIDQMVYDYIVKLGGGVSFVELTREFGKGTWIIEHPHIGNVVVWCGMSKRLVKAISRLLDDDRVIMVPTPVLVYVVDGNTLNIPVARNPNKKAYKNPRWLPMTVSTIPQYIRNGGKL